MIDRENLVMEILRDEGFARIPALASRLRVSESTVRRILARLDDENKVSRVVGGAILSHRQQVQPTVRAFDERKQVALPEKLAIARRAAALVADGDTVFLGGGSTVGLMPQFLRERSLQVVTNSLAIAAQLEDCPSTEVLVTGGYLFPRHRLLSGPITLATLRDLHFTWSFVGAAAFNVQLLTEWNVMIAEVTRIALERSERSVALVDTTKFNRLHLARVCPISALDYLISGPLPPAGREALERAGVRYLQATEAPEPDGAGLNGRRRPELCAAETPKRGGEIV